MAGDDQLRENGVGAQLEGGGKVMRKRVVTIAMLMIMAGLGVLAGFTWCQVIVIAGLIVVVDWTLEVTT